MSGNVIGLRNPFNEFGELGDLTATNGIEVNDKLDGLIVAGTIRTNSGNVLIHTEGGDLTLAGGASVGVLGGGDVHLAAGRGFNFRNLNAGGAPAISLNGGRFLIYSNSAAGILAGNLSANEFNGYTFADFPPVVVAGTDNRFLYDGTPFLTVRANPMARHYGDANPIFTYTVSGFLPGDTVANTVSGNPLLATTADSFSNVGSYPILVVANNFANFKGYGINYVFSTLEITPRPISLSGSKPFDGGITVDASALSIGGLFDTQRLVLNGVGSLSDPEFGSNKPLDVSGLSLSDGSNGGLASNYTLAGGQHRVSVVSLLTGLPSDAAIPLAEAAPLRPASSAADFSQLPGEAVMHAKLVLASRPELTADDLIPKSLLPVAAVLAGAADAPVATEHAPAATISEAIAESPLVVNASLSTPAPDLGAGFQNRARKVIFGADESFAHGKSDLSVTGRQLLDKEIVATIKSGYPVESILITGHTDPTGSVAFNRALSKRRAESGRDYLVTQGLSSRIIRTEGRASDEPISGLSCAALDFACLAPHRRLEILLTPKPAAKR